MSQHNKRRKGRSVARAAAAQNRPPWALLFVLGLGLAAGAFLLVRASQSGQSPSTATSTGSELSSVPPVAGAPRVSVVQDVIDHGDVRLNTPVESVFTVRNIGDRDLVILGEPRVELVEGC